MRKAWRWFGKNIGPTEVLAAVGLGLLALGFYDYWRPGAFIVPGAVLLTWSVSSAWFAALAARRMMRDPRGRQE